MDSTEQSNKSPRRSYSLTSSNYSAEESITSETPMLRPSVDLIKKQGNGQIGTIYETIPSHKCTQNTGTVKKLKILAGVVIFFIVICVMLIGAVVFLILSLSNVTRQQDELRNEMRRLKKDIRQTSTEQGPPGPIEEQGYYTPRNQAKTVTSTNVDYLLIQGRGHVDRKKQLSMWEYGKFISESTREQYRLSFSKGTITILNGGVHLFFAQITFTDNPNGGYQVLRKSKEKTNPDVISTCMLQFKIATPSLHNLSCSTSGIAKTGEGVPPNNLTCSNTGSFQPTIEHGHSSNLTCTTTGIVQLRRGDVIYLKRMHAKGSVLMNNSTSFFGLLWFGGG